MGGNACHAAMVQDVASHDLSPTFYEFYISLYFSKDKCIVWLAACVVMNPWNWPMLAEVSHKIVVMLCAQIVQM